MLISVPQRLKLPRHQQSSFRPTNCIIFSYLHNLSQAQKWKLRKLLCSSDLALWQNIIKLLIFKINHYFLCGMVFYKYFELYNIILKFIFYQFRLIKERKKLFVYFLDEKQSIVVQLCEWNTCSRALDNFTACNFCALPKKMAVS